MPAQTAPSTVQTPLRAAMRLAPLIITLFVVLVFFDSLRFKFTDHPNTQEIFGRLDAWAASFGADGLFSHTGLFSQYVIGTAEFAASALLLAGLTQRFRPLAVLGSVLGLAVMTGAISFHLFTPLGVDPNSDGGGLFMAACAVWAGLLTMLLIRRKQAAGLAMALWNAVQQQPNT
jgi:hypothetical protein